MTQASIMTGTALAQSIRQAHTPAVRVVLADPLTMRREVSAIERGQTIASLDPKLSGPYIAILNGQPVLRADWPTTRPKGGDVLLFTPLLQGPAVGVLVAFAASAASSYVAAMVGGGLLGLAAGALTAVAVSYALSSVLMPTPSNPAYLQVQDAAAASPTYSLTAQSNSARVNQPVPVQYGRMRRNPDLLCQPYTDFRTASNANGDMFLTQSMMLGCGEYDIESVTIDDTPIGQFDGVQWGVVQPGQAMPVDVRQNCHTAPEIGANTLTGPAAPIVITAVPEGRQATAIEFDIILPRGLGHQNTAGGIDARSATLRFEYRATGSAHAWVALAADVTITAATVTPQRRTFRYTVPAGRWEVRATRIDTPSASHRDMHETQWAGLKADLVPPAGWDAAYGHTTRLWVVMRASEQLTNMSARSMAVVCTRRLPLWNGSAWTAPVASRAIAPALADILRNADYGPGLPDNRIDLAGLHALHAVWAARGDELNCVFDGRTTVHDALTRAARAGRSRPFLQGGLVRFARDGAAPPPVCLFTPGNILPDSLRLSYIMPGEATADTVICRYWSQQTWKPAEESFSIPGGDPKKTAEIDLFGVTSAAQAQREARYMAQNNRWRRRMVSLDCEMEGLLLSPLDTVLINHDLPDWGQWAYVNAWDDASRTMTLDRALIWGVGSHFAHVKRRDGSPSPVLTVSRGLTDDQVILPAGHGIAIDSVTGQREPTVIAFGQGAAFVATARVLKVTPRDEYTANVTLVLDDARVHENA